MANDDGKLCSINKGENMNRNYAMLEISHL